MDLSREEIEIVVFNALINNILNIIYCEFIYIR
jgi:hypothetical protein